MSGDAKQRRVKRRQEALILKAKEEQLVKQLEGEAQAREEENQQRIEQFRLEGKSYCFDKNGVIVEVKVDILDEMPPPQRRVPETYGETRDPDHANPYEELSYDKLLKLWAALLRQAHN